MQFNCFRRFLRWQVYAFYDHLDPIANLGEPEVAPEVAPDISLSPKTSKWDLHFLLPVLIALLAAIHGNLLLPVWVAGVPPNWASLSSSETLFFRQIFPRAMWPQTDIAVSIATFACITVHASFWRHPWRQPRYVNTGTEEQPTFRIGQSTLSRDSSLSILAHHGRIKKLSLSFISLCSLFSAAFLYGNAYLNGYYSWRNGHFLFSLALLLPFYNDTLFVLFALCTFIILASVLTQILQKEIITQMKALNGKLATLKAKPRHRRFGGKLAHFRHQSRQLNRAVLSIVSQLEAYATYWKPSLSLIFLNHTTLQAYLAYTVFFIDGLIFLQKIVFLYMTLGTDVALFCLITLCARVVKLNRRIEVENRHFYLFLHRKGAFHGKNTRQQLKCEALATSHRLRPYAFQLFDNYRITSRTFYMVFSNLILFSLLVFKKSP